MIKVYETKEEKKAAFKRSVGLRNRLTSLNDRGTILSISLSNGIDFLAYRSKQKITIRKMEQAWVNVTQGKFSLRRKAGWF